MSNPPPDISVKGNESKPKDATYSRASEMNYAHRNILNVTRKSTNIANKMIRDCEQAHNAGIEILVMLDEQLEQFDKIDEVYDKVNQSLHDAEEHLTNLEKCCGLCVLPWKSHSSTPDINTISIQPDNFENSEDYMEVWGKAKIDPEVNAEGGSAGLVDLPPGLLMTYQYNIKDMDKLDSVLLDSPEEKLLNKRLAELHNKVAILHNMAVDICHEMTLQNIQIPDVLKKVLVLSDRVSQATKRTDQLRSDGDADSSLKTPGILKLIS